MPVTPSQFNAWRVMPRLLVIGYMWLVYLVADWFMSLSAPLTEQSAFVSVISLAGAGVFKFYAETGNATD